MCTPVVAHGMEPPWRRRATVQNVLFRVLGSFEVLDSCGHEVKLDRRQVRSLLAILVLKAGRTVPAGRLCELLWDQEPPGAGRGTLRTYVARIRAALAKAAAADDGVTLSSGSG